MADDEPMSSTSPRSGRRGIRAWASRLSVRPAAAALGVLATLLLAVAIASGIMKLPGKTGAGATTAPGPATAAPAPRPAPPGGAVPPHLVVGAPAPRPPAGAVGRPAAVGRPGGGG